MRQGVFLLWVLVATCVCLQYPTHSEIMGIHILKTDSSHKYFNRLVNYTYTFQIDQGQRTEGYKDVFLKKAGDIKSLTWFKLSYALGSLANEELFTLPSSLPKFGSFLTAKASNDDDFVSTGFLAGTFFSLANNRITEFERTKHSDSNLYWYSYSAEHFCVDQLYKVLKFYPSDGMHRLLTEGDFNMFKFSYAATEIEYSLLPNRSQVVKISLLSAIPEEKFPGLTRINFTPIEPLDPEDESPATTEVQEFNHYMEKFRFSRPPSTDSTTLKGILAEVKDMKLSLDIRQPEVTVERFVRGRIGLHTNNLITLVTNKGSEQTRVSITAVFDSHQYAFLSDISVRDEKGDNYDPWTCRYVQSFKKPHGNLNITVIETNLTIPANSTLEIDMPFLINFRKISEYEQEYERGTYLLGSIAQVDTWGQENNPPIILPPIQTNEKQIDSTFAFTTLTVNNIFFFMVPITLMYNGVNLRN